MNDETTREIYDPNRWGLPAEAIANLGNRLQGFWERFREHFKTKTRKVAGHAWTYLRGLLLMKEKSAGAGRQHNGRLGKVEMSQVGVFLAYYKAPVWTWVDGEL